MNPVFPGLRGAAAKYTRNLKIFPSLVRVTQIKSDIKAQVHIKESLKKLGLGKLHKSNLVKNTSPIRGYINTVTDRNSLWKKINI